MHVAAESVGVKRAPNCVDSDAGGPRLSIIIATWQAAATLEQCLGSIIGQDFEDWELLVSDGGSTDGSTDILRSFGAHIAWWNSQKDQGIYDAWNRALVHAAGEYVCFLGADDALADRQVLSRIFKTIGDQSYDLVTSIGRSVDANTGDSYEFGSAFVYQRIGPRTIVCHPGLLHRRSLFETYGIFDTRYKITADLDFLLRLPPDVRTLHVALVSVIVDAGGISRTDVLSRLKEQREVLKRCPRYGLVRAYIAWLNKLWRYPIARLLGIPH